jgi:short-subunit dehydrogenase
MKWALITGASAGLGTEFAKLFARDGHSVVLTARREDRLHKLRDELLKSNPMIEVDVIACDLSADKAPEKLCQTIAANGRTIDYLVNNAGFGSNGRFTELNLQRELEMIDLNVRALVELTGRLTPAMVERRSGRILNVGSTAGFGPGPYMATYYASKAFVNSFSEALAVLAPGPVATEFAKAANLEKSPLFQTGIASAIASADEVAEYGYRAMMRGEVMTVHGAKFKTLVQLMRVTPRSAVRHIAGRLNRIGAQIT